MGEQYQGPVTIDTGREHAQHLCNQLDAAVAQLLTPGEGSPMQQAAAAQFAQTAGQLERMLLRLQARPPATKKAQLQQEIQELESILAQKKQLLQQCQENIQSWQRMCDNLQELHHKNIFNLT